MTASYEGHLITVEELLRSNAQVNSQAEVSLVIVMM